MQDAQGRKIRYLRLSLTKACAMKCVYCRPEGFHTHRDLSEFTPLEIETLARHLVQHHELRKLRLTGGEPTSRPDLLEIIQRVSGIEGLQDIAMTTNGLTLGRQAPALKAAGLKRVNVSLDSLKAEKFDAITGVDGLSRVLKGISVARDVGLWPVRINTVVVRGENDRELPELLDFAAAEGLEIRFIELMPMGPLHAVWDQRYVSETEMRQTMCEIVQTWQPVSSGSDSARRYIATLRDGRIARVGFITAMSHPFCDQCDRIRIGAVGEFYACLMDQPSGNIMPAFRPAFDPVLLDELLREGLMNKAPEHPARGHAVMIELGG